MDELGRVRPSGGAPRRESRHPGTAGRLARHDHAAIGARVFQVVDAYDAITTERPYQRAKPHDHACAEIARASGIQFDPAVVAAFLSVPEEEWVQIRDAVDLAASQEEADPGRRGLAPG